MQVDIFQQIHEDHLEVSRLIDQLRMQPDRNPNQAVQQLKDLLLPHAKTEELTLYALLLNHDEARAHVLKATEEHGVMEAMLEMFGDARNNPDRLLAKLTVLEDLIQHHVDQEESRTFSMARSLLTDQQIQDLSRRFASDKESYRMQMQKQMRRAA